MSRPLKCADPGVHFSDESVESTACGIRKQCNRCDGMAIDRNAGVFVVCDCCCHDIEKRDALDATRF